MDKSAVPDLYAHTLGLKGGAGDNPLCGVRIEVRAGWPFADVHLCMRRGMTCDQEDRRALRDASRKLIGPHLGGGETMRCWLAPKNDPRISLRLRRRGGGLGFTLDNERVAALIEHWCREAGVSLS